MVTFILQPHIPHYRQEFFDKISLQHDIMVYCYSPDSSVLKEQFEQSSFKNLVIKSYNLGPFMWYNPFKLIKKYNDQIVLMLDFKHISTWFLLFTSFIHKKKIILWGQGISIKRYLKDESKTFFILKCMLKLSDGVWFYTEKEKQLWKKRIPNLNAVALNNTISDIKHIIDIPEKLNSTKRQIKDKYNIVQPIVFIFCARFTADRRIDLFLEIIQKVDKNKFGFIIIGEGDSKPSFSNFLNVYDFGKVYDFDLKTELFAMSDIYFQPAWLGLSVVEAMGYGKPVFTFQRSNDVLQCVEYFYVKDGFNGRIFNSTEEMVNYLMEVENCNFLELGHNAKKFARENFSMDAMVNNALLLLKNHNF